MKLNKKSGITVTSIVVYVILFFVFTSTTITMSSRFNKELFNDRGNAINITAINKLETNLLNSANNSYSAQKAVNGNKVTLTFSNSDEYVFDLDSNIIYKNNGKLVKFLTGYNITAEENLLNIQVTLNKYTNQVTRTIKINVPISEV